MGFPVLYGIGYQINLGLGEENRNVKCTRTMNKQVYSTMHVIYEVKVKVKSLSHVQLFVTPWTAAYQAPPSVGFSKQEY